MDGIVEYLPYIIDGVIIIVLLLGAIIGYRKGFFKGLAGILSIFVALAIAAFAAGPIIEATGFTDIVAGWLAGTGFESSAATLAKGIVALALFVVSGAIFKWLMGFISTLIQNIPILGAMERFLGFVLGIAEALVIVCVLLYVANMLPMAEIGAVIAETKIASVLLDTAMQVVAVLEGFFASGALA